MHLLDSLHVPCAHPFMQSVSSFDSVPVYFKGIMISHWHYVTLLVTSKRILYRIPKVA